MKIDQLVDPDYFVVSILDEMTHVQEALKERPCYVVMGIRMNVLGIITVKDVVFNNQAMLIELDFQKPVLSPNSTVTQALELMKSSESTFLPVYKKSTFLGTISLFSITEYLLDITTACSHTSQNKS